MASIDDDGSYYPAAWALEDATSSVTISSSSNNITDISNFTEATSNPLASTCPPSPSGPSRRLHPPSHHHLALPFPTFAQEYAPRQSGDYAYVHPAYLPLPPAPPPPPATGPVTDLSGPDAYFFDAHSLELEAVRRRILGKEVEVLLRGTVEELVGLCPMKEAVVGGCGRTEKSGEYFEPLVKRRRIGGGSPGRR